MEFVIAHDEDKDEILQMYNEVKRTPFCVWNDNYPTIFDINNDIERKDLFVLKDKDEIIGAVSIVSPLELDKFNCWEKKENVLEIARLIVKKEYQGKGNSKIILQKNNFRSQKEKSIRYSLKCCYFQFAINKTVSLF
ncbi:MAG: GNAT family N-acetyltransferase [Bacilli bacterium]